MTAAKTIALLVAAVGAGHLLAWLTGYMERRGLGALTMKTNAALALTATGVSLFLAGRRAETPLVRRVAQGLAILAASIGAATLCENITGWNLGIDELLAEEAHGALGTFGANRMGPPASSSFLLGGLSLFYLNRRGERSARIGQALAIALCQIALFSCLGYIYGAQSFYTITRLTAIAWPTAASLLGLGVGALLVRPSEGVMAQVTADDPGGVSLRRWPAALLLPVALGWLVVTCERYGFFDAEDGTTLVMLIVMGTLWAVAYRGAVAVSRSSGAIVDREERLRLSHQAARMGAFDWDVRNGTNVWTPELETIYGLEPGTFPRTQSAWEELVHPEDRPMIEETIAAALSTGQPEQAEWRTTWPDGTVHWIAGRWRVFRDGSGAPARMVGVNLEITERKRMEEALEATIEDLERSNKELEQFAYVCAHDLKEPLRQVRTFVELLKRHLGPLDDKGATYFRFISTGSQRMNDLITGILAYSRAGSATGPPEWMETEKVVCEAVSDLSGRISETGTRVTYGELPGLNGSPVQIRQLFQNLIGNAIKFRRDGIEPRIHVGCRRDPNGWTFSVEDNGIGIPAAYHQKVFRMFQRLHGSDKYDGTGIGLAVCQKIVDAHRGRIWIEPSAGGGSTFFFTIPEGRARASGENGQPRRGKALGA